MAAWRQLFLSLLVFTVAVTGILANAGKGRFVGAPMVVKETDSQVQEALNFAMKEYNKASNDVYTAKISKVILVERQLVSGLMYTMDVQIGRTVCRKSNYGAENCEFHQDSRLAKTMVCKFAVWIIPWQSKTTLMKNDCQ